MIKKLIKKEKKQLIALFISLISLIIFSLLDNKIDKILFFFIGDLIIIFVDVCLELKKYWKIKKIKNSILKETFIDRTVFIRSETVRSSMSLFCDGNKLRSGQPRTSATVYNREMCLLALQTIAFTASLFLILLRFLRLNMPERYRTLSCIRSDLPQQVCKLRGHMQRSRTM